MPHIVPLSRGLPLCTFVWPTIGEAFLRRQQLIVDIKHVEAALPACFAETAQTVREQYHKATLTRKGNIYKEVLLAGALVINLDILHLLIFKIR